MSTIVPGIEQTDFFCADLSREAGEPMAGTAPAASLWFLLEYDGPWTARATEDNDLPPSAQAWLAEGMALAGKGRVQFIKQNRPSPTARVTLFVALTREVAPLLYEFHLDSYDALQSLDVAGLLADTAASTEHLRTEPLYLVCTNGRRDRCCARLGLALYQALDAHVGDAAWQCTHLGGHRFAPTLATFPDGTCYGRLAPADIVPMVNAQEAGELYLNHLRGRCCYDDLVQAADAFLRQQTGQRSRDTYRLLGAQSGAENLWFVRFAEPGTGVVWQLTVKKTSVARPVSCSPVKGKPVAEFQLLSTSKEE